MKNKAGAYTFLSILALLSILNFFNPDTEFSEHENRFLQMFPEVTFDKVVSGRFSDDFELWVQDQFVFRKQFIISKAVFNQLNLKLENNGVYIGENNYLFDRFVFDDYKAIQKNIDQLSKYEADIILIPSSYELNKDKISSFAYNTSFDFLINKTDFKTLNYINVKDSLKGEDYFKTDHHININGAYKIYEVYSGFKSFKPQSFTLEKVSDDFKGSMYSKSGLFYYQGEEFYSFKELNDLNVKVVYDSRDVDKTLVTADNLLKKDKYTYFLDGNHGLVEIDNLNNDNGRNLLIITDSYGHIVTPLLVNHFDKINCIDLRYYLKNMDDYIKDNEISDILILYGLENFAKTKIILP